MKSIHLILLAATSLFISAANAQVDYVEIGKLVKNINTNTIYAKEFTACNLKALDVENIDNEIMCHNLTRITSAFKAYLVDNAYMSATYCQSDRLRSAAPSYYQRAFVVNAKGLAKAAKSDDPVHELINKAETNFETALTEIKAAVAKADLQNLYAKKCLFADETPTPSVKELVCQ